MVGWSSNIEGILHITPFDTEPAQKYMFPPDIIFLIDKTLEFAVVVERYGQLIVVRLWAFQPTFEAI